MSIQYKTNIPIEVELITELYQNAGLNRPIADAPRIAAMYAHSNLVISAWQNTKLLVIARSLTDFNYRCYLSDLAVAAEFQKQGIGNELIQRTKKAIGEKCMLLLLSAPGAMEYYPKVGFEKVENGFIIKRNV